MPLRFISIGCSQYPLPSQRTRGSREHAEAPILDEEPVACIPAAGRALVLSFGA